MFETRYVSYIDLGPLLGVSVYLSALSTSAWIACKFLVVVVSDIEFVAFTNHINCVLWNKYLFKNIYVYTCIFTVLTLGPDSETSLREISSHYSQFTIYISSCCIPIVNNYNLISVIFSFSLSRIKIIMNYCVEILIIYHHRRSMYFF